MYKESYEKKWQDTWKQKKVFIPKIDEDKQKYFATVPYPYGNSALHIGHGRTMVAADILVRYQRLLKKNVLFPMAFHISGTPVLAVFDGLSRKDPDTINMTRNAIAEYEPDKNKQEEILDSFTDPYKIADYFSGKIEETFDAVGLSIDWTRQFNTGEAHYQKFIDWQFHKLREAGMLIQGKYPILFSPKDNNAVGEDDIKDGDVDKVTIQEMIYILFKHKKNNEYLAVATLRPDALFGTTNLWVDPSHVLAKIKINSQTWIVGIQAYEKLRYQYEGVELIKTLKGEELIGQEYITPLIDREVIVASASFIDENHGMGIVYSSPAGSPHDYMGLVEARNDGRLPKEVKVINTVDTKDKKGNKIEWDGECPAHHMIKKYSIKNSTDPKLEDAKQELYKLEHYGGVLNSECGEFAGIPIKHAKEKVTQALIKQKLGGILLETSRRAKTRSGNNVIVANLEGQWFLDYSKDKTKRKAYELLDQMDYYPASLKDSQKGYLEWVQKRPCARKRGIGTPLPFDKDWVIESLSDSTIYQMFYLFSHLIKDADQKELTYDFFQYVLLGKGNPEDLVGETLTKEIISESRKQVEYWKSFDFRYTAPPHMSNHLSFLIYHYSTIFDKEYWPKNITVGGLLIREGQKISKSKGNGIPLIQVPKKFGVDLYRLYVAIAATIESEMDFRDEEIHQLEKRFTKFKELLLESKKQEKPRYEELEDVDKWLISKFYTRANNYFELMNQTKVREAYVNILYEFLNEISYHQRRSQNTSKVLRFILEDYLKLMTPVMPHFAEECNPSNEILSTLGFDTDTSKYIDNEIENNELIIEHVLQKTSQYDFEDKELIIVQAPDQRFELFNELKQLLDKTRDIKEIFSVLLPKYKSETKFIQKFVPKTLKDGLDVYLSKEEEKQLLKSATKFLKEETKAKKITIEEFKEEYPVGLPAKPIILRP
ncbi:MAG: leucine--tRNA ligase [Candidatus Woesearchaeota archaeon]